MAVTLDVFNSDAFGLLELSKAITDLPHQPGRIGELKWFDEDGITTTTTGIERIGGQLSLVADQPRGGVGSVVAANKARVIPVTTAHLPQRGTILADQLQGVRAFGKQTAEDLAMDLLKPLLKQHRANIEVTLEYHRMGAIRGQALDADGTTVLWDSFSLFNLTKQTQVIDLNNAALKTRKEITIAKRKAEDKLGGKLVRGWHALCSAEFMDALYSNPKIETSYDRPREGGYLRADVRSGLYFADVFWEEYRGTIAGIPFVPAGKALLVPVGVDGMFITRFAPANMMSTVNTKGIPFYVSQELLKHGAGVEFISQSNPLTINTQPDAVIELSLT